MRPVSPAVVLVGGGVEAVADDEDAGGGADAFGILAAKKERGDERQCRWLLTKP
jgi:hypothetical protein